LSPTPKTIGMDAVAAFAARGSRETARAVA
jgi:hypothetical protein